MSNERIIIQIISPFLLYDYVLISRSELVLFFRTTPKWNFIKIFYKSDIRTSEKHQRILTSFSPRRNEAIILTTLLNDILLRRIIKF